MSLGRLASSIYHEKQQDGSMLCAQHALNSLLQGSYFTAPDLSEIARSLDQLEQNYDDANSGTRSTNMDDTGFFSIQVLESALHVWGLHLVRWRSEAMLPYQERPYTQLAFILNLEHHWFTLRRFGPALPDIDNDPGEGHWFNLNSFLPRPEWVGKTYLGMVLQQSEAEGYSVFAVVQTDPAAPLALPRTEADQIAPTIQEPTAGAPQRLSTSRVPTRTQQPDPIEGFEDEDMELQAALQASLVGGSSTEFTNPPSLAPARPLSPLTLPDPRLLAGTGIRTPTQGSQQTFSPYDDELDPISISLERNRAIMARIRQEQEHAQRELYEEEIARIGRGRHDEGEEEMMRRTIEESEAFEEEGPISDIEDDRPASGRDPLAAPPPHPYPPSSHVYDDEDAELQAALRASLEHVPPGFVMPETPERPSSYPAAVVSSTSASPAERFVSESDAESAPVSPQEETLSVDEMRRRRLARFGA